MEPWQYTFKRKSATTSRFYYFDIGVKNKLAGITTMSEQTDIFGQAFEQFIAMELRAYLSYTRKKIPLCFWRMLDGCEVDFIVGDIAIEVKSTRKLLEKHFKNLKYLQEKAKLKSYYLISQDSVTRKQGDFFMMHWREFLLKLWSGKII